MSTVSVATFFSNRKYETNQDCAFDNKEYKKMVPRHLTGNY